MTVRLSGAAAAILLGLVACGGSVPSAVNVDGDGVAIHGTDPVAYFTEGRAMPGRPEFTLEWRGARWRFASTGNRERFAADPETWAPRYGGYCAYGVARGSLVDVDPEAWTIHEGRLYLNVSQEIREVWSRDIAGYVERADRTWPGLVQGR